MVVQINATNDEICFVHHFYNSLFCLYLTYCQYYGRWASACYVTNPTYCNVAFLFMPGVTKDPPGSRLAIFEIFYLDAVNSSALFLQLVNQWLNFTYYSRSQAFRTIGERTRLNATLFAFSSFPYHRGTRLNATLFAFSSFPYHRGTRLNAMKRLFCLCSL